MKNTGIKPELDGQSEYYWKEFLPKYSEPIVEMLRARELNRGVSGSASAAELAEYGEKFADTLNDAAVMIDVQSRGGTVTEALRLTLDRKLRVQAQKAGLNSRLIETD